MDGFSRFHPDDPTVIREATVSDAHAIADVHVAAWRSTYTGLVPNEFLDARSVGERESKWRERLHNKTCGILLKVEKDQVIGFACYGSAKDEGHVTNSTGEIQAIYLKAEFQRRGFGRELWNSALSLLAGRGMTDVVVWVFDLNLGSRRFYETMGCRLDGGRKVISLGGKELLEVRYRASLQR